MFHLLVWVAWHDASTKNETPRSAKTNKAGSSDLFLAVGIRINVLEATAHLPRADAPRKRSRSNKGRCRIVPARRNFRSSRS